MSEKTAFIICGALAREVLAIIERQGWDAEVAGIPALDHMFPERIAPDVEKRLLELKATYQRIIVVFGDCGSRGALDQVLDKYGIERVAGPHCYEMYAGSSFHQLMAEEPGTFFLTDFLVRGFDGLVIKGLGLDRFPILKDDYFRHYQRLVYIIQVEEAHLLARANEIAAYLDLPLEVRHTGYGLLEERLINLMESHPRAAKDDSYSKAFTVALPMRKQ